MKVQNCLKCGKNFLFSYLGQPHRCLRKVGSDFFAGWGDAEAACQPSQRSGDYWFGYSEYRWFRKRSKKPPYDVTVLYRYFDRNGGLLYVGVSLNAVRRLGQHATEKAWYNRVANVTLERFLSRETALEAEQMAIITEKPEYNLAGKPLFNSRLVKTPVNPTPVSKSQPLV